MEAAEGKVQLGKLHKAVPSRHLPFFNEDQTLINRWNSRRELFLCIL